ncbi:MAG TPA: anti-sigma factor [Acidimicrobiales bacterium]|nr:anti-sigma factor [Acidimicrobiales bacterium]
MSDDEAPGAPDMTVDPALARLLADPAVWAEPPDDLRARTLAAATGAAPAPLPHDLPRAVPGPRHAARGESRPPWGRRVLLAAAAVVVLGLVGVAGVRLAGDGGAGGTQVALAGTEALPGAHATARLRHEGAGVSVELDAGGLPPAPEGTFYEAWLVGKDTKVSAGTFHRRGDQDTVKLWLGVDPADYDALTVTRQPVAGGTTAPGVVVLRGKLPR